MANVQGKIVPHSLEAEQSALACVMLDYVNCGEVFEKLSKADFYSPAHQTIFEAMKGMLSKPNQAIDLVTVIDALTANGKLDSIGGVAYLTAISQAVPSVANFRHYLEILKKNRVLRRLNTVGAEIVEKSYTSDNEQTALDAAQKAIFDIAREDEKRELVHISSELPSVINTLDNIRKNPSLVYGLMTRFYDIDKLTNGLHGGELVILAARPGIGKTSLGLNMVLNAAIHGGKKCAIFSLEMSKASLTQRALCSLARVSSYKAGRGELGDSEYLKLLDADKALSKANVYIDDSSDITHTEIKTKCMRLKQEHGLDFVMVDYLGLMATDGPSKRQDRQNEVAANSRAMKILAKELDVPVLLLAQLNRNVETRNKKGEDATPALHDLRESGAIEQDADIVMFIHMRKPAQQPTDDQEEEVVQDPTPEEASIIIAKHRKGPCGTVKLVWRKECTTFENMDGAQRAQIALEKARAAKAPAPKAPPTKKAATQTALPEDLPSI